MSGFNGIMNHNPNVMANAEKKRKTHPTNPMIIFSSENEIYQ